MKNILVLITAFALMAGCTKAPDKALATDKKIIGRLFLLDTLTQTALNTPLPKKKVSIRETGSKDTINYLYSATTTDDGYFTFNNLTEGKSYSITYSETINGILYSDQAQAMAPSQNTALYAHIALKQQKGILFTVKDYSGNVLKDASICVFTSSTNVGYQQGICDGSSLQLKTDANGRNLSVGLQKTKYYTVATATLLGMPIASQDTVAVTDTVTRATINLKKPNGLQIDTRDLNGDPVANVNICVFTSNILFQKGGCDGSNFQLATNSYGHVDKFALPKATYYLYSSKIVGKDTLEARTTVMLDKLIIPVTQTLKKK